MDLLTLRDSAIALAPSLPISLFPTTSSLSIATEIEDLQTAARLYGIGDGLGILRLELAALYREG